MYRSLTIVKSKFLGLRDRTLVSKLIPATFREISLKDEDGTRTHIKHLTQDGTAVGTYFVNQIVHAVFIYHSVNITQRQPRFTLIHRLTSDESQRASVSSAVTDHI